MFSDASRPLYEVKANLFKGLAHPMRVRMLEVLSSEGEVPVSRLVAETGLEPSNLSQHLGVLRKHLLVTGERRGSQVYYRLSYPQVAELLKVARGLLSDILAQTNERLAGAELLPVLPDAPAGR